MRRLPLRSNILQRLGYLPHQLRVCGQLVANVRPGRTVIAVEDREQLFSAPLRGNPSSSQWMIFPTACIAFHGSMSALQNTASAAAGRCSRLPRMRRETRLRFAWHWSKKVGSLSASTGLVKSAQEMATARKAV